MNATIGPGTPATLAAARSAVLAALTASNGPDGYAEARKVLAAVPAGDLVDVAALLALMVGQPGTVLLTRPEWVVVATALGVDP